jgi:hypothetical protein
MFSADEIILLTAPDDQATWLEEDLDTKARERFSLPVTALTTR